MFKNIINILLGIVLVFLVSGCEISITDSSTDTNATNTIIEEKPVLNDSTFAVDENLAVGSVIGRVDVVSQGSSQITSYAIDDTVNFEVLNDGTLKNRVSFDYETQHEYDFNVYATNSVGESAAAVVHVTINDVYEALKRKIPTVVIIMNWSDYSEDNPTLWHDKIFNVTKNSVNRWYAENTVNQIEFTPVHETQGIADDGIIMVNMNKNHPGGSNDETFRDTEIKNAISNAAVVDNMDFAALDRDGDGSLSAQELQIIFIVAGGEQSYGDSVRHSVWAHAWAFDSTSTLKVHGVYVMRTSTDNAKSGMYARFGANHGDHKATIGIMCHELGHAAFFLKDYYDNSGGSGLGWYDIMSDGAWASQTSDIYPGETPTQYTAFNKIDAGLDVNVTTLSKSATVTLGCSGRDFVKLTSSKTNEYFLLGCRDTAKSNSDISLSTADSAFGENTLFTMMYHVDTNKEDNTQDGAQTADYHYKVAVVEKDGSKLMTSTAGIYADFSDVYTEGDLIIKTDLYDGSSTGYSVEVVNADYINRKMTLKVTKR